MNNMDALPKYLFIAAIAAVVYGFGFVSGVLQIFPYQIVKEAQIAVKALLELRQATDPALENMAYWDETGLQEPTYEALTSKAGKESIFYLGNDLTYPTTPATDAENFTLLAWIAGRDGSIKHAWKHPGEIWDTLGDRDGVGDTWRSYPIGAHLYDNGDILVTYQGVNVFPIGMGIAKFDKDSNLLWKKNGLYHHWFSVSENGDIYVPGTTVAQSPLKIHDREKRVLCTEKRFPLDTIAVLGPDGVLKKEIDLLNAFLKSDLIGVFNAASRDPTSLESCDPMHLNDVRVLSSDRVADFPQFESGDLLVSFRALNAVGILDPDTELFKWFHVGSTQHQHSPRYFGTNKVLMFDNWGGNTSQDITRVLAVDVGVPGRSEVIFPKIDSEYPDRNLFSKVTGHIDVHPAQQRALVAFSEQGFLWEIDLQTGDVLWEMINTHVVDQRAARVNLFVAKYADDYSFAMNGGQF